MRVLFVKLSAIGDVLHATPVAEALRIALPDAHLAWAVHPHCAPVVRGNPYLNEVILWPRRGLYPRLLAHTRSLRQRRFDAAVDLQGLFKSALVARLSGAQLRIGPEEAREWAGALYTKRVARDLTRTHVVPGYLRLAEALTGPISAEPPMHFPVRDEDRLFAEALLASAPRPRVVLNPSAGRAIKQWMPDRFGAVGDALIEQRGASVILSGAPSDRALADAVLASMRQHRHVLDLTGKMTLPQLAAMLSMSNVFVGGDTGPMHIAQAVGTPVVAIFGPTDPRILGPRLPQHATVWLQPSCSPCRHRECPIGHVCLRDLEAERVTVEVIRILDGG